LISKINLISFFLSTEKLEVEGQTPTHSHTNWGARRLSPIPHLVQSVLSLSRQVLCFQEAASLSIAMESCCEEEKTLAVCFSCGLGPADSHAMSK